MSLLDDLARACLPEPAFTDRDRVIALAVTVLAVTLTDSLILAILTR